MEGPAVAENGGLAEHLGRCAAADAGRTEAFGASASKRPFFSSGARGRTRVVPMACQGTASDAVPAGACGTRHGRRPCRCARYRLTASRSDLPALNAGARERDHAILMNRTHCGLHLFGNVLPAAREVNRQKASKHYRDFVQDRDRLDRIEEFVRVSDYWDRVSVFGDLQGNCEAQYRAVDALCRVNKRYLENLLPVVLERDEEGETERPELGANRIQEDVLPISLNPSPAESFRKALLREKRAWIVEAHRDGRQWCDGGKPATCPRHRT